MKNQYDKKKYANSTQHKIIDAATTLFIENGFNGTSISQIAKTADVNRSLIFHHFCDKSNLWLECKLQFLANNDIHIEDCLQRASNSKDAFIDEFVVKRFQFYQKNPRFIRLMAWQALDKDDTRYITATQHFLLKTTDVFKKLQNDNAINPNLNPITAIAIIANITSGYFIKNMSTLLNSQEEEEYLSSITTMMEHHLNPK